jgi:hypothetical protein
MRRTRMMLVGAAAALALSAAGTGIAQAQSSGDPELAEQCGSYGFFEWLFHHECHGHTPPYIVYWPGG